MGELRIVLHTDQFEAACHFYGDLLGWPVTKQWDEPEPGRIFGYGDSARIELLAAPPGTNTQPAGVLVAVEVQSAVTTHDALVAAGVAVTQPLAAQPWGHRNFSVVDPTGLTIVFFEVLT